MKLSTKILIVDVLLIIFELAILMFGTSEAVEVFILPTEGSQSFPIELKEDCYYDFKVPSWSGDEIINISIRQGENMIFSVLLEGEKLEYRGAPEDTGYPDLGRFQAEETGNYQLDVIIIEEPAQKDDNVKLALYESDQFVLGFDARIIATPVFFALACGFFALFASLFYELFNGEK
ncbi:MAG: hypothetical protein ACFFD4_10415 [Candidatus Odinarchaeota archaeon]